MRIRYFLVAIAKALIMLLWCFPTYSQYAGQLDGIGQDGQIYISHDLGNLVSEYRGQLQISSLQQSISLSQSKLQIPEYLPKDSQEKISQLWNEIIEQCTGCSTGVTIGGGTIVGGNGGSGGGGTLFPINKDCDTVNEEQIRELRRKAALYDELSSQERD